MKYPTNSEIQEILNAVSDDDFIDLLPQDASNVDKIKYQLCKKVVSYIQKEKITQAELSRRLDVDRSRINWIVKYRIEHFTIDWLYELIEKLDPDVKLKVS